MRGATFVSWTLTDICTRTNLKGVNPVMKRTALMLLLSVAVAGCGLVNSKTSGSDNITASFSLTDTTGQADTTFAPGQNFYMTFFLVNTSGKTVTYTTVDVPAINFEILKGDSVIGGNVFAVSNIANPLPIKFLPGDTLRESCEAPKYVVGAGGTPLVLGPGSYFAKAIFPQITGANVSGASGAGFTVHQ